MDPLAHLYPVHQIGSDGFSWWIGQVETATKKSNGKPDPKRSGRYKVRIIGHHPKSCNAVTTDDLPWAITMMPVTTPYGTGATRSGTPQLEAGDWVVGFFLDREQQQPVIMGSIGQVAGAGPDPIVDPNPNDPCKSFNTYLNPDVRAVDQPAAEAEVNPTVAGHALAGGSTETPEGEDQKTVATVPNLTAAKRAEASKTNRAGNNWTVSVATKCSADSDLNNTFTRLLGDMLRDIQQSDGQLGTFLVGKYTGQLYDKIDIGREYVNKASRIVETFVAKVKGYVLEKLKRGLDDLIKLLLRPDDKGNALTPITKWFNEQLKIVGCSMADLGLRLQAFLEELLFGYLFDIYKAAACQIDKLVSGILNKIQSLLNEILEAVLGPLQAILGAIATPLNIIGEAVNYVLKLLGISCDGPDHTCKKKTSVSTKCKTQKRGFSLDDILDALDEPWDGTGADWSTYTCEEAYEGTTLEDTGVDIVGGFPKPPEVQNVITYNITNIEVEEGDKAEFIVTRSGLTTISSSVTFKTLDGTATSLDYETGEGVLGFSPGETEKPISIQTFRDSDKNEPDEDFFVVLRRGSPDKLIASTQFTANYAKCTIKKISTSTGVVTTPVPESPSTTPPNTNVDKELDDNLNDDEINDLNPPDSQTEVPDSGAPQYSVVADKLVVEEGDFITYTITTENVETGVQLGYTLFGTNITSSDIVSGFLQGDFVIEDNTAKVIVGIAEDGEFEKDEPLIFAINGTDASALVTIKGQFSDLSEEELLEEIDDTLDDDGVVSRDPIAPVVGDPITDLEGRIIEIPIKEPGDPYVEPPAVIIFGEGVGATALPLLDQDGRVTEIRVTDPGSGFKVNTPEDSGVRCIIDSFTMLSPGREYTTAPSVFVNGELGIAEAVIDDNGFVISVRILDRETTYDEYPTVTIVGGGGYGARFIPSFACLDTDALVRVGSAKIGTGRYIDCP